jgi:hypothetical protein
MIKRNTYKSRDLPVLELLARLEVEYVVWELRRKIYPERRMKDYYEKGMAMKKERILDISLRNNISNIFVDEKRKQRAYFEVYGDKGFPNFHYKDECLKDMLEAKDIANYYCIGSDIRIEGLKDFGKIFSVDFDKKEIIVIFNNNSKQKFNIDKITRIL